MSTTTAIKERPILFQPAMAQAAHDGTKTQTRRVMKPQPHNDHGGFEWKSARDGVSVPLCSADDYCPYGVPGDRLWVREAVAYVPLRPDGHMGYIYRGDEDAEDNIEEGWSFMGKWTPSIHMPRAACRTILEITEVRVQRVQDIDSTDALAEGMTPTWGGESSPGVPCKSEVDQFLDLFYNINKRAPRDQNPWVWAITFRKVAP